MEKIMSKTNDTSRFAALENHHPLADSELDAVSGGEGTYLAFKLTDVVVSSGSDGPVGPLPKVQPPKYPGYP
jgi:hypothetical protein